MVSKHTVSYLLLIAFWAGDKKFHTLFHVINGYFQGFYTKLLIFLSFLSGVTGWRQRLIKGWSKFLIAFLSSYRDRQEETEMVVLLGGDQ